MPWHQSRLLQHDDTAADTADDDAADATDHTADDNTADDTDDATDDAANYNNDDDADNCGERRESAHRTAQLLRYRECR